MSKIFIEVINPKGVQVTIDEERWPELSRKGYKRAGDSYIGSKEKKEEENEYLEVEKYD